MFLVLGGIVIGILLVILVVALLSGSSGPEVARFTAKPIAANQRAGSETAVTIEITNNTDDMISVECSASAAEFVSDPDTTAPIDSKQRGLVEVTIPARVELSVVRADCHEV